MNVVGDTHHALERAHHALERAPLIIPVEFTTECDPTLLHQHFDPIRRYRGAPFHDVFHGCSDFGVAAFMNTARNDVDFHRNRAHPTDTLDRAPGRYFFSVGI